jgi:hypothetical protein
MLTYQLTHLELLNAWNGGLTDPGIESLTSCARANNNIVTLHLLNSSTSRQLASSVSRAFSDRTLYLRLVVWKQSGEEMVSVSPGGVVLESRVYTSEVKLIKNYLPQCRFSSFLE